MMNVSSDYECCILGAGPAGFGTAVELVEQGIKDIVIIDRNKIVGGLSRTEEFGGARFDVGPHRFFTMNQEVNQLWRKTLGEDFKPVERLTRIYYKKKYFNYPIKASDTLLKLGPSEALLCCFSFARSRFSPHAEAKTFEDWITQKFGRKLYETFFKTYTEKVWGIECNQIGAEWAAQRIKNLDVLELIKNTLFGNRNNIKTLVEQFDYPVRGAGQMYEAMCDKVVKQGAEVMLQHRVIAINKTEDTIRSVDVVGPDQKTKRIHAKHFFSSIPLTHFIRMLSPAESENITSAADALYYREHITVNLLVDGTNLFPDQWIYVHSPDVKMARLANYNNFSASMSGDKNKTALSLEYFAFATDEIWQESDESLIERGKDELQYLGLVDKKTVEQSWVVRETESYPTYYLGYLEPYGILKKRINQFQNLLPIGRGGMYKYNNQDHSLLSGLQAARNYHQPENACDLWGINTDEEYQEGAKK